jgi:murein DD-endopeptidase MepM/ murein hydrolase activator NlpD
MATTTTQDSRVQRTLKVTDPSIEGPDVTALQQALNTRLRARGRSPIDVDGDYGPMTHQAALDVAWFLGIGPAASFEQPLSPYKQKLIRNPKLRNAKQLERAGKRKHMQPPVPGGIVRPLTTRPGRNSEFAIPDTEGAPSNSGTRFHAGKDWFAPGHSPVKAPVSGKIVEAKPSLVDTGQVFGGTAKILAADGKVWVFRHVIPQVSVGQRVRAGQLVAKVTLWKSGPSHSHIEVWKTLNGGVQDFENMIDPMKFFGRFA